MKKKQILMALIVAVFLVGGVGVTAAHAQTNHQNTSSQGDDNNKPGWGFGDKNHHHVGPPGHSVKPGDGDNDNDDNNQGDEGNHHLSQAQLHQFIIAFQNFLKHFFI